MKEVALSFHLLGAFLFLAGIVLAGATFESARRRESPSEVALLLSITRLAVLLIAIDAFCFRSLGCGSST